MRLTITAKQSPTLLTQLRARSERQRARAREATVKSAERVLVRVLSLVWRDTNYAADHTRVELIENGLGYKVGWRSADFVGKTNPATGTVITSFYVVFPFFGTRFRAGFDPLTPALQAERPNYRRAMSRALSG